MICLLYRFQISGVSPLQLLKYNRKNPFPGMDGDIAATSTLYHGVSGVPDCLLYQVYLLITVC